MRPDVAPSLEPGSDPASPSASVFFVTLGCPKNEVDTDRMQAHLDLSGYRVTDDPDEADIVVLNTCGFIEDAVSESIDTALGLAAWRDARDGRRLIVAGCMVSRYGSSLENELTEPDAYVAVADEHTLPSVIAELLGGGAAGRRGQSSSFDPAVLRTSGRHSAYLQVADGCFRDCAFCTIPSIRGPYRSRTHDSIVTEARTLVDGGAREIVLIGQDISAWGRDLTDDRTLADIAASVAGVTGVDWLRLMYVQPDGISERLLEMIAATDAIVEYLDLPLQHASPSILRAMNRSGSAERFLELLARIRATVPGIALRTTFIAGFPGETDRDVEGLIEFIDEARFEYAGVFPYSPEDGTPAATLPGLPDATERLARAQAVRDAADTQSTAALAARVGTIAQVLVDGVDEEGVAVGRLRVQAPEVDGLVFLDRSLTPGTMCDVRITDSLGYDLEGSVVTC